MRVNASTHHRASVCPGENIKRPIMHAFESVRLSWYLNKQVSEH